MLTRPQIGKQITVVTKNLMAYKQVWVPLWNDYTVKSDETHTHTGTVVKPDYWMKSDEFNMTTGLSHFPVRTISLKNVVSINGVDQSTDTGEKIEHKQIQGSKNNVYTVMLRNGVAETCSCPGFLYRGGRCKHLSIAVGAPPVVKAAAPKKVHKAAARKVTKIERARELYHQCKGDRKSTIQALKRTLKMSDAGASTYYHKIKKEA